ncbi:uncharacterized protein DS421_16g537500 [Arachis hypogaea]|nr:uncharacterized protein DS421_16g537500 [Arachis hypogaea]
MVPNPNYMPPSATLPADPVTELAVGDSSSAPQQDAPSPSHVFSPTSLYQTIMLAHRRSLRKIYDHRAAKRLQQTMCNICKGNDHLTLWIRLAIKKELKADFNNDEGFKRRSLTNIANRASPRLSKYTGGSATFMKTKSKLSKSLDHETTLAETFKYTHILKANNERFAEERSAAHYILIGFGARLPLNPTRIAALGWSFFASGLRSSALAAFSASATNLANPQEVIDLREEVQKLTHDLHQQAKQSEQRYNDLLARVGGAVTISSNLIEKLEQFDRLREQMEAYNQQMRAKVSSAGSSGTAGSNGNATGGALTSAPTLPPQQGDHDDDDYYRDLYGLGFYFFICLLYCTLLL